MIKLFLREKVSAEKGNGLLFRKILFYSLAFITFVAISLGISFMFFSGQILKKQITKSSGEVLRQISYNIDQAFTFIDNSAISLSTNGLIEITLKSTDEPVKKFSEYQDIINMMWILKNTNKYVHSVFFYLENDKKVLSSQGSISDFEGFRKLPWVNMYQQKKNAFIDTYPFYDESLGKTVNIISIVKSLPLNNNNTKYGAIIVNLDEKQVNSTINSDRIRENEQILIINNEGVIISSQDTDLLYKTFPWSEAVSKMPDKTGTYQTRINKMDNFIIFDSIPKYGWKVVSIIPSQDLFKELNNMIIYTMLIIAIGLLLFFPMAGIFSSKMYNPIRKLVNLLKQESADKNTLMKDDINYINQSIEDILKDRKTTNQMLERIKPVVQEKFLKNLLKGNYDEQQISKAYMQMVGFEVKWDKFTVIVIEIDNSNKWIQSGTNYVQNSFMSNLKDNIKAFIEDNGYINYIVEVEDNRIGVIINSNIEEEKDFDNIYIMCLELKDYIARKNSYTITIGIGNTVYEITNIKSSYQQAILAVKQKLVFGKNSVIRICDIQENSDKSFSNKYFIESVIKNIRELNIEGAINEINKMTDIVVAEKVNSRSLNKFFYSLLNIIMYTISDMGVNTELIFSSSYDLIDDFLENEDVDDIKKYFYDIFRRLEQTIEQKESSVPNDIIYRVKEYINEKYMLDISLNNISDIVYLHPHYLGKIFKKHEGITIIEYLTYVRMEHAKELLTGSDEKVSDISQLVGISSPQYFIHCFKEYQGITPKKYRELNREINRE